MGDRTDKKGNDLLIVAGEDSGDMYGALLAESLREISPATNLFGMGGKEMKAAGVEVLHHIRHASVTGIVEVLANIHMLRRFFSPPWRP